MEHCEPVWCLASGPSSRCCFFIAIRCPSAHLLVCSSPCLFIPLSAHILVCSLLISFLVSVPPPFLHIFVSISLICIGVSGQVQESAKFILFGSLETIWWAWLWALEKKELCSFYRLLHPVFRPVFQYWNKKEMPINTYYKDDLSNLKLCHQT